MLRSNSPPGCSTTRAPIVRALPLAVALGLAIPGFAASLQSPPGERPTRPNFLFVVIDTLRADRMSSYGNERETTPYLDALATRGLRFENAIAQAPWTGSSMASLWTGLLPSETGVDVLPYEGDVRVVRVDGVTLLPDEATTLAEMLREHGYHTMAACSNPWAMIKGSLLQGFDDHYINFRAGARDIVDHAIGMLRAAEREQRREGTEQPFALYVHFMDVHEPTNPPAPYDTMFPTLDGEPHTRKHHFWGFDQLEDDLTTAEFAIHKSHKLALYDGALRHVDDEVERLHAFLEQHGDLAQTVTVVTSDHGEELWDHREFMLEHRTDPRQVFGVGHGHTMFRELLHVPLIFHGPGVPHGTVSGQVRNIDVVPTVLGLADLDDLASDLGGVNLTAAVVFGDKIDLPAFAEHIGYGREAKSIQDARFQYLEWADHDGNPTSFLFDKTAAAPADALDVQSRFPQHTERLRDQLHALLVALEFRAGSTAELDEETAEAIRALGYTKE